MKHQKKISRAVARWLAARVPTVVTIRFVEPVYVPTPIWLMPSPAPFTYEFTTSGALS